MCHFYTDPCKVEISSLFFYSDFTFFPPSLWWHQLCWAGFVVALALKWEFDTAEVGEPSELGLGTEMTIFKSRNAGAGGVFSPISLSGRNESCQISLLWKQKAFSYLRAGTFDADLFTCILLCLKKPFLLKQGRIMLCLKSGDALLPLQKSLFFSPRVREFNPLQATITQEISAQGNTQSRAVVIRKQIQMSHSRGVQTLIWFSEESYECYKCLTLIM